MQLSSLDYGIVCINKRVTYITIAVVTSTHDCLFERYTFDLDLPKSCPVAHFIRSTVPCIVKKPIPSTYYTAQRNSPLVSRAPVPL